MPVGFMAREKKSIHGEGWRVRGPHFFRRYVAPSQTSEIEVVGWMTASPDWLSIDLDSLAWNYDCFCS